MIPSNDDHEENDDPRQQARNEPESPNESSSIGSGGAGGGGGGSVITTDPYSQMRTTLAIGELIASSRPSAGSRLIANEIRSLTEAIRDENAANRREIDTLASTLVNSLKNIMEEESERRTAVRGFMPRRFPVFRRPPRFPFATRQMARKSIAPAFGNPPSNSSNSSNSSSNNSSNNTSTNNSTNNTANSSTNNSPTSTNNNASNSPIATISNAAKSTTRNTSPVATKIATSSIGSPIATKVVRNGNSHNDNTNNNNHII